jgi:hypothetical protein
LGGRGAGRAAQETTVYDMSKLRELEVSSHFEIFKAYFNIGYRVEEGREL